MATIVSRRLSEKTSFGQRCANTVAIRKERIRISKRSILDRLCYRVLPEKVADVVSRVGLANITLAVIGLCENGVPGAAVAVGLKYVVVNKKVGSLIVSAIKSCCIRRNRRGHNE